MRVLQSIPMLLYILIVGFFPSCGKSIHLQSRNNALKTDSIDAAKRDAAPKSLPLIEDVRFNEADAPAEFAWSAAIQYCIYAFATDNPAHSLLEWKHEPPKLGPDEIIVAVSLAFHSCAFISGTPHPIIAGCRRNGNDCIVDIGEDNDGIRGLETVSAAIVPRPAAGGRLMLKLTKSSNDTLYITLPVASRVEEKPVMGGATE